MGTPGSFLSHSLFNERVRLDQEAAHDWAIFRSLSWFAIIAAATTTIIIGMTTGGFWANPTTAKSYFVAKWLTLALPADTTAIAAFIAFGNPNGRYLSERRSLVDVAALQREIAVDLPRFPCFTAAAPTPSVELNAGLASKSQRQRGRRLHHRPSASAASSRQTPPTLANGEDELSLKTEIKTWEAHFIELLMDTESTDAALGQIPKLNRGAAERLTLTFSYG